MRAARSISRGRLRVAFVAGLVIALAATSLTLARRDDLPDGPAPRRASLLVGMNTVVAQAWPDAGIGALRLWDSGTAWPQLEPTRGHYDWSTLDVDVSAAARHGVPVLLTLGQSPSWASARPDDPSPYGTSTSPAEPADPGTWTAYVTALAQRYRGRIEAYEVWNEPNLPLFYTGTPETMAALAQAAAAAVHAADPGALVVSPGLAWTSRGGPAWFARFVAAGGLADVAREVRTAAGAQRPLWNTETGWGHTSPGDPAPWTIDAADAPGLLARSYLAVASAGVERLYWYGWTNRAVGLWLTETDAVTPTAAGRAYGEMSNWLTGASLAGYGPDPSGPGRWRAQLDGGPSSAVQHALLWWVLSGSSSVPAPSGATELRRLDGTREPLLQGQNVTLTTQPVLIVLG